MTNPNRPHARGRGGAAPLSRPFDRPGVTLIEVLAGLALLATLLAGLMSVQGRHARQGREAARRLEATAAAERLLSGWWLEVSELPRRGAGEVAGASGMTWRTQVTDAKLPEGLAGQVVRLEILESSQGENRVLTRVELLLPPEALPPEAPTPEAPTPEAGAEAGATQGVQDTPDAQARRPVPAAASREGGRS